MKDDNNRKNLTEPFDDGMADDLQDALTHADDVIEQALRRKELEDASCCGLSILVKSICVILWELSFSGMKSIM